MLSDAIADSYARHAADIARRTHDGYITLIKSQKTSRGSGKFYKDTDHFAAEHLDKGARDLFEALKEVNEAEPSASSAERNEQLQVLFGKSLDVLEASMTAGRERFLVHWDKLSAPPAPRPDFTALPKAAARARDLYAAKIHVAAVARSNSVKEQAGSVQNTFNAPVANFQSGENSTASVSQVVNAETTIPPKRRGWSALLVWVGSVAAGIIVLYIGFRLGWNK